MKQIFLFVALLFTGLCVTFTVNAQTIWYVDNTPGGPAQTGANDGTSWANAFNTSSSIQTAINAASDGDEIWVRTSSVAYQPGVTTTDYIDIINRNNLSILGGFSTGTETMRSQRDSLTNLTRIQGFNVWTQIMNIQNSNNIRVSGFNLRANFRDNATAGFNQALLVSSTTPGTKTVLLDNMRFDTCYKAVRNFASDGVLLSITTNSRFFGNNIAYIDSGAATGEVYGYVINSDMRNGFVQNIIAGPSFVQEFKSPGFNTYDNAYTHILNCVLTGNQKTFVDFGTANFSADTRSSIVLHSSTGSIRIANTISYNNFLPVGSGIPALTGTRDLDNIAGLVDSIIVRNSYLQNGYSSIADVTNCECFTATDFSLADPFINSGISSQLNFSSESGLAMIDGGTPQFFPAISLPNAFLTDLEGENRFLGCGEDIGVFEYQFTNVYNQAPTQPRDTFQVDTCLNTEDGWRYIYDENKDLIAAVEDPTLALGEIKGALLYNGSANSIADDGAQLLRRAWVIKPENQPTGNVNVRLYYNNADLTALNTATGTSSLRLWKTDNFDVTDLSTLNFTSAAAEHIEVTGFSTVAYNGAVSYLQGSVSSFSGFAAAANTGDSEPFPVDWLNISADREIYSGVEVTWSTASELNNERFEIQRSFTGTDYRTIGTIAGRGTVNEVSNYSFLDTEAPANQLYYRIRQVDFDGTESFSPTVRVNGLQQKAHLSVVPNPSTSSFAIDGIQSGELVRVCNMLGQEILERNDISSDTQLDVSSWPEGVYTVQVQSINGMEVFRLVKN